MEDFGQFTCGTDGINSQAHLTEYAVHDTMIYFFLKNESVSFREVSIHIFHVLAGQPLLQAARQQTARELFFFPVYSSNQALSGRSGCPRVGSSSIPGTGTLVLWQLFSSALRLGLFRPHML